jgi:hypothetical protein
MTTTLHHLFDIMGKLILSLDGFQVYEKYWRNSQMVPKAVERVDISQCVFGRKARASAFV